MRYAVGAGRLQQASAKSKQNLIIVRFSEVYLYPKPAIAMAAKNILIVFGLLHMLSWDKFRTSAVAA